MNRIWKWPLEVTDLQTVSMPSGAKVLAIQTQHGQPVIWALVDESAPKVSRVFVTYGTGYPMPDGDLGNYVGTYQISGGSLVFHVFESEFKGG